MKKTLSIILVAVMLISALASLIVPAAAVEASDNWKVEIAASAANSSTPEKNPPIPGYYYDSEGLHTVSPDYTNFNPKFTIVSKEMYNIKDFTMTVVIHDYCASGDNWLSFSVWSESNGMIQGDTSGKYGDGWTSLIRAGTDGNVNRFESWDQRKGGRSGKMVFSNIDGTQLAPVVFDPNVDAETGDITMTFAITNGVVSINGKTIGAGTDQCIADRFKEGLAYVAVTLHNTNATGEYHPTMSLVDVNGEVPTGTESREPEVKTRKYGDMIDSDTVPANTPAVWFDSTLEYTNKTLPKGSGCKINYADDNQSLAVTVEEPGFFIGFEVPDEITYNASDFTYAIIIYKNYCTCNLDEGANINDDCMGNEVTHVRYCAGTVTSANDVCLQQVSPMYNITPVDESGAYTTDDCYTVSIVQILNSEWKDRIHSFRFDYQGYNNFAVEGKNTFEVLGAGIFRTGSDVVGFLNEFRGMNFNTEWVAMDYDTTCDHFDFDEDGFCDICEEAMPEDPVEPPVGGDEETTEAPAGEVTTEAPAGEVTTEEGEESGSEEETTKKPAATTAASSSDDGEEEVKKGCGSVASMGALAIIAIIGTGIAIKKKD